MGNANSDRAMKKMMSKVSAAGKKAESAEDARKREILEKLANGAIEYDPEFITQGDLQPARLGRSGFEDIVENSAYTGAQQDAMARYKEQADNGGFSAADRATQAKSMRAASQQDAARRQSILSEMQQRGTLGSGGELAAKLAAADAAASLNSQDSLDLAANGEARRDEAIANRSNLAGNMREQDYKVSANRAEAGDAVDRFNADLQSRMAFQNNQTQNQATQWNAGTNNDWNTNVAQLQYNGQVDIQNRQAQRKAERAASKNGALVAAGTIAGGVIGSYAGPGGTVAGAQAGGAVGGMVSDENKKKDISDIGDIDLDKFLESIKPKSYDYKDESNGKGKRVGFMAQDIENNPVGSAIVRDDDDGKEIDVNNLLGALTAAIARLDDKKRDR